MGRALGPGARVEHPQGASRPLRSRSRARSRGVAVSDLLLIYGAAVLFLVVAALLEGLVQR
jgi:hypothetical protein